MTPPERTAGPATLNNRRRSGVNLENFGINLNPILLAVIHSSAIWIIPANGTAQAKLMPMPRPK